MSAILAMHDVTPYILIAHTAEKRRKENEMRLIDADALLKKTINSPLHAPYITEKDIREMPTIQPVATDTNVGDTISRQSVIDLLKQMRKDGDMVPWEGKNVFARIRMLPALHLEERTEKRMETHACEEKPFKLPKIYVAEGFDSIEGEDGNIGFGVYVPAENKIYVAGDVDDEIRAKALLHEVCHWVQDICGRPFDEDEANEFSDIVYNALPSAQPYTAEEIQKMQELESAQVEKVYELGRESAQPETNEGEWIVHLYKFGASRYECDSCHARCDTIYPYCPYCGEKKEGERNATN